MSKLLETLRTHRRAFILFAVVVVLDPLFGLWFAADQHLPDTSGMCYTLGVVSTSGSSVPPGTTGHARLITALTQLLLIPLGAAVISLFTAKITTERVTADVTANVGTQLHEHHQKLHKRLDEHFGKAAPDKDAAV